MELEQALESRRSVRKYTSEPVDEKDLKEILQAALLAPSWKNSQSHRYYVIQNGETLVRFKKEALPAGNAAKVDACPVLIVSAFVDHCSGIGEEDYANEIGNGWGLYDLGLADENLLLKARELGYGTLVMGIRDAGKIRELLQVPADQIIVSVIGLGRPESWPNTPKHKEFEEMVTYC
jgi:nitroreductase